MTTVPHLLYRDLALHRPNILVRLHRDGQLVGAFGADFLTQAELEVGVLNRACSHARVSMCDGDKLARYSAEVEGNGVRLQVRYDSENLEFYTQLWKTKTTN